MAPKAKDNFAFNSVQTHIRMSPSGKEEVTEAVSIRNGKGTKTVSTRKNKQLKVSKKKLSAKEIKNIKNRKFMPTLFKECHTDCNKTRSTRKKHYPLY
jgi:hypothetical protein